MLGSAYPAPLEQLHCNIGRACCAFGERRENSESCNERRRDCQKNEQNEHPPAKVQEAERQFLNLAPEGQSRPGTRLTPCLSRRSALDRAPVVVH